MRLTIFIIFFFLMDHVHSKQIHIFGDSHSCEFSHTAFYQNFRRMYKNPDSIPLCIVHYLGPVTMHRIGRDGYPIENTEVKEGDIVIFAFGEIDARCHILKQTEFAGKSIDETIDILANNYLRAILKCRFSYQELIFMVYSVTSPIDLGFNYQEFPYYGSLDNRVIVTKKLNAKLSLLCEKFDVAFIDVYDHFAIEDGSLNPLLSDGNVHISPKYNTPIWNKIKLLLLEKYPGQIDIQELFEIRE